MKTLAIDVRDFAMPVPRTGSIEPGSGYFLNEAAALGQLVHSNIQWQRKEVCSQYRAEMKLVHKFEVGRYVFAVSGRADGVFDFHSETDAHVDAHDAPVQSNEQPIANGSLDSRTLQFDMSGHANRNLIASVIASKQTHIEEIKTAVDLDRLQQSLDHDPHHPYALQAQTYGYMFWKQTQIVPSVSLHLVSLFSKRARDFSVNFSIQEYERWLELRLHELEVEAKRLEKQHKRRLKLAEQIEFPFAAPRPGQDKLIAQLETALPEKHSVIIQAPTGLGKTVAVLYPLVREALARGQRLVWITPRNTLHLVPEQAIKNFRKRAPSLVSLTLSAKAKQCFLPEPNCHPDHCEYARDYFTKVSHNDLVNKIVRQHKNLTAEVFKDYGRRYKVCPFELAIDCINRADVVIADYNHALAPQSLSGRLTAPALNKSEKPNLVIDEAHNLHSRATDYFSADISTETIDHLVNRLSEEARSPSDQSFGSTIAVAKACQTEIENQCRSALQTKDRQPLKVQVEPIVELNDALAKEIARHLADNAPAESIMPLLELSRLWDQLTRAVTQQTCASFAVALNEQVPGTGSGGPSANSYRMKIKCCDASSYLQEQYQNYNKVVAFSATIKPFAYYSALSGLNGDNTGVLEAESPFPKNNRKLLLIKQVSTKFADRQANYGKIADAITRIIGLHRANYIAFFPSFAFLESIRQRLIAPEFTIIAQPRQMSRTEYDGIIASLQKKSARPILLLAVQGGSLAEGVDYAGDMAAGAIIVGPGLPSYDLERELLRDYYEKTYGHGFEYAYSYPAMTKVIQAAGRVVRSETDRGLIVLMDGRFLKDSYTSAMPKDWFTQSAHELVSTSILSDISKFWQGNSH